MQVPGVYDLKISYFVARWCQVGIIEPSIVSTVHLSRRVLINMTAE